MSCQAPPPKLINIRALAKKIDVDNRIPLRDYYQIADTLLKQADAYRKEKNIVDLYIVLLRFSSVVSETIPFHKEYQASDSRGRKHYKKKLLAVLDELESLRPQVQRRVNELNKAGTKARQTQHDVQCTTSNDLETSLSWPSADTPSFDTNQVMPVSSQMGAEALALPLNSRAEANVRSNLSSAIDSPNPNAWFNGSSRGEHNSWNITESQTPSSRSPLLGSHSNFPSSALFPAISPQPSAPPLSTDQFFSPDDSVPANQGEASTSIAMPGSFPATVSSCPSAPPVSPDHSSSAENFSIPVAPDEAPSSTSVATRHKLGCSLCVICWEAPVEGACVPCGHVCCCMSCLKSIKDKKGVCPMCRSEIDLIVKLYII